MEAASALDLGTASLSPYNLVKAITEPTGIQGVGTSPLDRRNVRLGGHVQFAALTFSPLFTSVSYILVISKNTDSVSIETSVSFTPLSPAPKTVPGT